MARINLDAELNILKQRILRRDPTSTFEVQKCTIPKGNYRTVQGGIQFNDMGHQPLVDLIIIVEGGKRRYQYHIAAKMGQLFVTPFVNV